jgi:hypothetical protein
MTAGPPAHTHTGYDFIRTHTATGNDFTRREEPWAPLAESLLRNWSLEWRARAAEHEKGHQWWKRVQYSLDLPSTILPLLISAIWGRLPPEEGAPVATATLALSGCLSALSALLQAHVNAERHLHAGHRYADLISDLEETLCKEREYRPDVDVTIQSFKMRSDMLLRTSPAADVPTQEELSDSDTP